MDLSMMWNMTENCFNISSNMTIETIDMREYTDILFKVKRKWLPKAKTNLKI